MAIGRSELRLNMRKPTILYHVDHPEGVFFDAATEDLAGKASGGWADHPGKLNIFQNTGMRRGGDHPMKLAVDRGDEPMIDLHDSGRGSAISSAEVEAKDREIRRLQALLEMQSEEQVSAEAQEKRDMEEHADGVLTAARDHSGLGGTALPKGVVRNMEGNSVVSGHTLPHPDDDGEDSPSDDSVAAADASPPEQEEERPKKAKSPKKKKDAPDSPDEVQAAKKDPVAAKEESVAADDSLPDDDL